MERALSFVDANVMLLNVGRLLRLGKVCSSSWRIDIGRMCHAFRLCARSILANLASN